jgi:hypothetical protein
LPGSTEGGLASAIAIGFDERRLAFDEVQAGMALDRTGRVGRSALSSLRGHR